MIMDPMQYEFYYGNTSISAFAGAGLADARYRWPKGVIPYTIDGSARGIQRNIEAAMREWGEKTCIKFTPSSSRSGINIFRGGGCFSGVGYSGRGHRVSLGRGCEHHGTILHELGHTIGLHHEQCRKDRDNYVKIAFSNIGGGMASQFSIMRGQDNFGVKYDPCSIMHYGPTSFGKSRGLLTIVAKDQDYQWSLGSRQYNSLGLMFSDTKIVNKMYNCDAHCTSKPKCDDPCYVNHKCQCVCEDKPCPKMPCRSKSSASTCNWAANFVGSSGGGGGGGGGSCADNDRNCNYWARRGECNKNPNYMLVNCKKSCGKC